jgi:hypothetical protein
MSKLVTPVEIDTCQLCGMRIRAGVEDGSIISIFSFGATKSGPTGGWGRSHIYVLEFRGRRTQLNFVGRSTTKSGQYCSRKTALIARISLKPTYLLFIAAWV